MELQLLLSGTVVIVLLWLILPQEESKMSKQEEPKVVYVKRGISLVHLLLIALLGLGGAFGYGYYEGQSDLKSGTASLFSMGLKVNGMNPVSAYGYRLAVTSNPEVRRRLDGLSKY